MVDELNNNVTVVAKINEIGKALMKDQAIASSVKATILNVNRRFEKLKTNLPPKHKKLKHLQRLDDNFRSGLEEFDKWISDTTQLLHKEPLKCENFRETRELFTECDGQMKSYEKYKEKIKTKNSVCSQIENIVGVKGAEIYWETFNGMAETLKAFEERWNEQYSRVCEVFFAWEKLDTALKTLKNVSCSSEVCPNTSFNIFVCQAARKVSLTAFAFAL